MQRGLECLDSRGGARLGQPDRLGEGGRHRLWRVAVATGAQATWPSKAAAQAAATSSASRVLPIPPGPTRVRRRASRRESAADTTPIASPRPTRGVSGAGRGTSRSRRRWSGIGWSGSIHSPSTPEAIDMEQFRTTVGRYRLNQYTARPKPADQRNAKAETPPWR